MKQIIKRIGILFGIFAAALLVYLVTARRADQGGQSIYVDMGEAALPVLEVEMFGRRMNPMVGYCQEMDNSAAAASLTILPEDRALTIYVEGMEDPVSAIRYEIRSMDRERLVERTQVGSWEQTEDGLKAVLPIQNLLTPEQEYLLRIELDTELHGQVFYYTRILETADTTAQSMLDLAADFSARTFDYDAAGGLVTYIEPTSTQDNSSLGTTTIHSSFSQLTWGNLDMEPISPVRMTLSELDGIMCSVQLAYLAQSTPSEASGGESAEGDVYEVTESFTMKWNELRTYLMDYERRVDQIVQGRRADYAGKRILLGITNDDRVGVERSPNGKILAYRANRDLWSYDQSERRGVKIFSFRGSDMKDLRNSYARHDIRILSVEDSGDVDFLVYGYMNRGNHEGNVGIAGYHYDAGRNMLEELYFIPYSGSYEALEHDLDQLAYQTEGGMLYLYMDHAVFGVDLKSRENMVVADALEEGSFAVSADGSRIAWQEGGSRFGSPTVNLLDLETGDKREIRGEAGEFVRVLGFVDQDLVYGVAGEDDSWIINGRVEDLPMRYLRIINEQMEEETRYEREGYYIAGVEAEGSRVHLNRMSKTGPGRYVAVMADTIVCNDEMGPGPLDGIGWYVSEEKGRVYFVQLDQEISGSKGVHLTVPRRVRCENADWLELKSNYQVDGMRFYAYGDGHLLEVSLDFTKAVQAAYDRMGYVTDQDHRILWDRVNRGSQRNLSDGVTAAELILRNLEGLEESRVLDNGTIVIDGRGCTMAQMLYFIDQGQPVIAYTGEGSYLILTGFDPYNVTVYDPAAGASYKMGLNDGEAYFAQRGNDFICAVRPQ